MKAITISAVTVVRATGSLTSDNTNVSDGDTVTIGSKVYTFKTTLGTTEGQVLIGTTADESLRNLVNAINGTGTFGTDNYVEEANSQVVATPFVTSHVVTVTAIEAGTEGNAVATTEASSHLSWGSTTLASGANTITITGTFADATFTLPAQRVTVGEFPATNTAWSRGHRISTDAVMVIRNGASGIAVPIASMGIIGRSIDAALTWTPTISTEPSAAACVASSTAATFTVVAVSEPTATYQWQFNAKATGTLTSDNTNVSNNDTVTIGSTVYTFKTALTPTAGEVLIGADADASLLNLIRAINHSGTPGTHYANLGSTSVANTQVSAAVSVTAHAFAVTALTAGGAANAYATTETSSHLSWGATTLTGGGWTAASGTVNGCVYTNNTTATLTCTPTTTGQTGLSHRCLVSNVAGAIISESATLTIT